MSEWKIDTAWMKFCFVIGTIAGFYILCAFVTGIILSIVETGL